MWERSIDKKQQKQIIFKRLSLTYYSPEEQKKLILGDLYFVQSKFKSFPKVYWLWNHRRWCLELDPTADWKQELELVNYLLEKDSRNCMYLYKYSIRIHTANPSIQSTDGIIGDSLSKSWSKRLRLHSPPKSSSTLLKRSMRTFPTTQHGTTAPNCFPHTWKPPKLLTDGQLFIQSSNMPFRQSTLILMTNLPGYIINGCW